VLVRIHSIYRDLPSIGPLLHYGLQSLRDSVGETKEVDVELGKKGRGYLDPEYQRISMGFGQSLHVSLTKANEQDYS
jgi:hypothetical protein